jgi:hypothetical protein
MANFTITRNLNQTDSTRNLTGYNFDSLWSFPTLNINGVSRAEAEAVLSAFRDYLTKLRECLKLNEV